MNYSLKILAFCIFFFSSSLSKSIAQNFTLSGTVKDSLGTPIEYANVIAKPLNPNLELAFAITNQNGKYKIQLSQQETYNIEVRYLGYHPSYFVIDSTKQSIQKDFILKPALNELQEIIIISDLPVSYKNDTLIYQTDVFVNGSERKLKQVLKKLPGVEVDRQGNITVHGKKVDKIMVEGEAFFSGGTKLAVENIPADAVNTVEVIDNYNEVEFLSEVSDSEELAMNITLKEDKKHKKNSDYCGKGRIFIEMLYFNKRHNKNM
ncbi:MAG: carboxypeptidase-like regulatory domain-containing protein [Bacteroidota bacterium]